MTEREYERLMNQAKAEYDAKVDAIKIVWRLSQGSEPPKIKRERSGSADNGADASTAGRGNVAPLVARAIDILADKEEFTTADVDRAVHLLIGGTVEKSSLSHAVRRLEKDGKLVLVEGGKGKRPSRYRRTVPLQPLANGTTKTPD